MSKGTYGYAGLWPDTTKNDGKIDSPEEVYDFLKDIPEGNKLAQLLSQFALKSQTPVIIEVTDITALTGDQLDALRCGDTVVKKTGTMHHRYHVSYKDETVGGLCLTYVDCENVETVAYEKREGVWTYDSTDITNIGSINNG